MQSQDIIGRVQHVAHFSLFVTPNGEILIVSGNQRVFVTPTQAHELLDHTLAMLELFRRVEALTSLNGRHE
jgi:hypothetical protein